jgi:hypothetical protein
MEQNPTFVMLDMLVRVILMDVLHAVVYVIVLTPPVAALAWYLRRS